MTPLGSSVTSQIDDVTIDDVISGSDSKNNVIRRHRMISRHRIDLQLTQNVCLIDILLVFKGLVI